MTELKRRFHKLLPTLIFYAWPWGICTLGLFFSDKIATAFHLAWFVMPVVSCLIWTPFIAVDIARRNQCIAREKQTLQARFDAEDEALFGEKHRGK